MRFINTCRRSPRCVFEIFIAVCAAEHGKLQIRAGEASRTGGFVPCRDRDRLAALAAAVDIEAARASVESDRTHILQRIRASAEAEASLCGDSTAGVPPASGGWKHGGGSRAKKGPDAMIAHLNAKVRRAVRRGW